MKWTSHIHIHQISFCVHVGWNNWNIPLTDDSPFNAVGWLNFNACFSRIWTVYRNSLCNWQHKMYIHQKIKRSTKNQQQRTISLTWYCIEIKMKYQFMCPYAHMCGIVFDESIVYDESFPETFFCAVDSSRGKQLIRKLLTYSNKVGCFAFGFCVNLLPGYAHILLSLRIFE